MRGPGAPRSLHCSEVIARAQRPFGLPTKHFCSHFDRKNTGGICDGGETVPISGRGDPWTAFLFLDTVNFAVVNSEPFAH
ncbi:MAG: hypothetical protein ACP5O0_06905 [Acidimicrobiales bacterium]